LVASADVRLVARIITRIIDTADLVQGKFIALDLKVNVRVWTVWVLAISLLTRWHVLRSRKFQLENKKKIIYLAQQHTNDNVKHKFQEPDCQKTLRSTMLATQTYNLLFIMNDEILQKSTNTHTKTKRLHKSR